MRLALLREEERNPMFADTHPDAARRARRLTREELGMPDQVTFLATRERQPVGMLRCRLVRRTPLVAEERQALVTTVFVLPDERRTGVLRALMVAADRWCRQNQVPGMRLQCSLANEVGQLAWKALGFAPAELLFLRPVPPA